MPVFKRTGTAVWNGNGSEGKGNLSTESGVLTSTPYQFSKRFGSESGGTNPEELIAAAHAGCFTMSLSFKLNNAGMVADELKTVATVTVDKAPGDWTVTNIHLEVRAKIPGADNAKFQEAANLAKEGCPISRLMKTEITMDAQLVS